MLGKILCNFLFFVALLWTSCGVCMEEESSHQNENTLVSQSSISPTRPKQRGRSRSLTTMRGKSDGVLAPICFSSAVQRKAHSIDPINSVDDYLPHYNYLLINYNYSEEFIKYLLKNGNTTNYQCFHFKPRKPVESHDIQLWRKQRNEQYEKYKRARKDYVRAQKIKDQDATKLADFKKKNKNFQPILREALHRHGSQEVIIQIQKIEEELAKTIKNQIRINKAYQDFIRDKKSYEDSPLTYYDQYEKSKTTVRNMLKEALVEAEVPNMVRRLLEIWNDLKNNPELEVINQRLLEKDLYELLTTDADTLSESEKKLCNAIKEMEKLIYPPDSKNISDKSLHEPFKNLFYLNSTEFELAIWQIKRLIKNIKRENSILEIVALGYRQDYLEEVTSYWSLEQWGNWSTTAKENEVKKSIKKIIESTLPYDTYTLLFIGKNPTPERLSLIKPREIFLYLKNGEICFKIKEKEIKTDLSTWEKFAAFKSKKLMKTLEDALIQSPQEEYLHTLEDQGVFINFLSFCGYLPDDFSIEQLSHNKKNQEKCLNILFDTLDRERKGGIGGQKAKPIKLRKEKRTDSKDGDSRKFIESDKEDIGLYEVKKEFLKIWRPFYVSNKVFTQLMELNPKKGEKPVNLEALALNEEILKDKMKVTARELTPHKQKMLQVIQELQKKVAVKDYPDPKGPLPLRMKDITNYRNLYNELSILLNKNRKFQIDLDAPYSWWTYIPTCRSFFSSDVPYSEQSLLQEIDLSYYNLHDNCFFKDKGTEEKMAPNTGQGLLSVYSKKVNLAHNHLILDENYPTLSPYLEELNLNGNTVSSLKVIENLKNLKILNLSGNVLRTQALHYLTTCTSLTSLNLAYNLEIKSISTLQNLTLLRELDLSGNTKLFNTKATAQTFNSLTKLPSLSILAMRATNLRGEWSQVLPTTLTQLQILDVRENMELQWNLSNVDFNTKFKTFFPVLEILKRDLEENQQPFEEK